VVELTARTEQPEPPLAEAVAGAHDALARWQANKCAEPTRLAPRGQAQAVYFRGAARSCSRSRSTRRCTLPVVVIGKAAMNSISFGYSYGASLPRTWRCSSSTSAGVSSKPGAQHDEGLDHRAALGVRAWARPRRSRPAGCLTRQFSISLGPMR
jgi:hypothetical protein